MKGVYPDEVEAAGDEVGHVQSDVDHGEEVQLALVVVEVQDLDDLLEGVDQVVDLAHVEHLQ